MEDPKPPLLPVAVQPVAVQPATDDAAAHGMSRRGVYAALGYMACAVLLIIFNKAALSSYNFPSANVITLLQLLCSCLLLYAMKYWRIISFTAGKTQSVTTESMGLVPLKTLIRTLPLALAYLLYMVVSMESVRGVNVPMYTTLRRTTVAFTMAVEYLLTGQKHSRRIITSVAVIILGAYVAGVRDLTFDLYSYGIVFLANICTAIYLALIARIGKSSGLNSFGLMWCNGIICAPILLLSSILRRDFQVILNFPHLYAPGFQVVMLLSCVMAFLLNYTVFLNTTLNSALTQTVLGNLKDLFTVVLGWLLFGGLPFDLVNIAGQSLGFFGSFLYAYYKLKGK
uniref:Sugar phosphate transporter domain-containing protein n=1 Tax=Kalanchoe fedtschenkoi TaxID=63787 RepID=A0A7N0ZVP0_KALFE